MGRLSQYLNQEPVYILDVSAWGFCLFQGSQWLPSIFFGIIAYSMLFWMTLQYIYTCCYFIFLILFNSLCNGNDPPFFKNRRFLQDLPGFPSEKPPWISSRITTGISSGIPPKVHSEISSEPSEIVKGIPLKTLCGNCSSIHFEFYGVIAGIPLKISPR